MRFEITAPLVSAVYCHCTRCQRRTGTGASASGWVEPGSLAITAGEDRLRAWSPGGGFDKVYCGDCGSAVFVRDPASGEVAMVRLGTVDGDPGVKPTVRQFVAYAAAWEPIPDDGLPRYDERMPRETPAQP